MREFLKPDFKVNSFDVKKDYGRFVLENLERGFGITLGNALRRVLLSSIPGTAVYRVTIQGARHEFSALEGVVEDVTTIILNLKGLVIKMDNEGKNNVMPAQNVIPTPEQIHVLTGYVWNLSQSAKPL